jgi:hypothetical protein
LFKLILLILGAHYSGDFLVYSTRLSKGKREAHLKSRLKALLFHCLIHLGWVLVWLWLYSWPLKIAAAVYIFVVHFLIDLSRPYMERVIINEEEVAVTSIMDIMRWIAGRGDPETSRFMGKFFPQWVFINLFDQGFHILSIILFAWIVTS